MGKPQLCRQQSSSQSGTRAEASACCGCATPTSETTGDGSLGAYQVRFDAGRYWTPHVRLGLYTASGPRFRTAALAYVEANGRTFPTLIATNARLLTLAPGVTYQFGDNAFLHPYLTGGLQIGLVRMHRERNPDAGRTPVPVPRIDEWQTAMHARPLPPLGSRPTSIAAPSSVPRCWPDSVPVDSGSSRCTSAPARTSDASVAERGRDS